MDNKKTRDAGKETGKRNPVHCCGERKLVEFLTIEIRIQISQNIRNKATIRSMNTTLRHMPKDLLQQRYSHMQAWCCSVYIRRGCLLEHKSYHLFILHSQFVPEILCLHLLRIGITSLPPCLSAIYLYKLQSSCLHSKPSTQPHSQLCSANYMLCWN